MPIAAQENAEIIKPGDDPLQFNTVDEEDCQRCFLFSYMIEEGVLKTLCFF